MGHRTERSQFQISPTAIIKPATLGRSHQCNGPACNCYSVAGGYRARILFDSGSTISLICKILLSLTNCDKNVSACDVVLLTASGEDVNPRNSVTLPLQLGSFDGRHHFVVMDSLLTDVILGTDFMTKYGICIDLGGRKIFGPSLGEIHILADNPAQSCGVGNESDNKNSDHDDEARICAIPNSRRQSQHLDLPSCAETYQNICDGDDEIAPAVIEHRIWTVGSPVKVPPRRVPEAFRADIEKQLQEMLEQGIIEPSNSHRMAPAVYTPKKSGAKFATWDMFFCKGHSSMAVKNRRCEVIAVPADKTSLKRFLGLTSYYRRFMESYATIAAPLYELLKDDAPFIWTENSQAAFDCLKNCLTSAPTLCAPNFADSFQVTTDASGTGLDAILEQRGRVIAFASRSLRKSERNYSAIEKECLAIIFALKTFRHYLLGRSFTILSDHTPLQWLAAQKMDGRLARWALSLQEYDYDIKYRPGSSNGNAEALSRSTVNLCALAI
ncbi:Retrovirus-related Pol polyprotein from transposon 17.6 [Trichinella spiralis]|uniref:RNA-directed DNA polymerase n=1 Tax=Trichinella spiralis TaxID=6334 RepID=A0ABR3K804_TRISP